MDLLRKITHCPNITYCYTKLLDSHPCSKIISVQSTYPRALDRHQVPEPWSGDIEHAPILSLASNPAIDEREEIPLWGWPSEEIEDFFLHRYQDGRKQWIKNGIRSLQWDGSYSREYVRFWASVRKRAEELLLKKWRMA